MTEWLRYVKQIRFARRDIESVDIALSARDLVGTVGVCDVQVQDGTQGTGYVGNTREFFGRERDVDGNVLRYRHYNGVLRGDQKPIVANRSRTDSGSRYVPRYDRRVTGGLDVWVTATSPIPAGGLTIAYLFGTRPYVLAQPLAEDATFAYLATEREASVDGVPVAGYYGGWQMVPAGFGRYQTHVEGSAYVLAHVDTWLTAEWGARL